MSGTPVLAALTGGLGGARPLRLRGVLNATVNFICSRLAAGDSYEDALQLARAAGLAERDPSADVDGLDSVAKVMVLSALVFGRPLALDDVRVRGVSELGAGEIEAARRSWRADPRGRAPRSGRGRRLCRGPRPWAPTTRCSRIEAATNALVLEADPLGEISITGPGPVPSSPARGSTAT